MGLQEGEGVEGRPVELEVRTEVEDREEERVAGG